MKLEVLGVPLHFGSDFHGVNCGITKLIEKNPALKEVIDVMDIKYEPRNGTCVSGLKYLQPILAVCENVAQKTDKIVARGNVPLIIGGDHSISIGSIAGVATTKKIGVVWIDAHGDMNTPETTPSGHIHGMPLAVSQGYGDPRLVNCYFPGPKVRENNVVLMGVRDLDKEEKAFIDRLECTLLSYDDIIQTGLEKSLAKSYAIVTNQTEGIHLSFDLDCIRPEDSPGVSIPVARGFSAEEVDYIFDFFLRTGQVVSIDLVEYNPTYDKHDQSNKIILHLIDKIRKYYQNA